MMFTTITAGELVNNDVVVTAERDALMFDRVIATRKVDDVMHIGTDAVSVMRNGERVSDGIVRSLFYVNDAVCIIGRTRTEPVPTTKPPVVKAKRTRKAS